MKYVCSICGYVYEEDGNTPWAELPESYDEISISGYRQRIYEYVYTRYKEAA